MGRGSSVRVRFICFGQTMGIAVGDILFDIDINMIVSSDGAVTSCASRVSWRDVGV
jgi:hypothetical protein